MKDQHGLCAVKFSFPLLLSFCHEGLAGMPGCLRVIEIYNYLKKWHNI